MNEPIYRSVYTVEVFSRGLFRLPQDGSAEFHDPFSLSYINYAITDGDCIGNVTCTSVEVVPPETVESELLRIGNDGSFFSEDDIYDDDGD